MKVFTTGQVAKICKVAPRTVSKWFDSGQLKGYRIPGSRDRRIPREDLIRFLEENGFEESLISALAEGPADEEGEDRPAASPALPPAPAPPAGPMPSHFVGWVVPEPSGD